MINQPKPKKIEKPILKIEKNIGYATDTCQNLKTDILSAKTEKPTKQTTRPKTENPPCSFGPLGVEPSESKL